jgi:hypothetical protein
MYKNHSLIWVYKYLKSSTLAIAPSKLKIPFIAHDSAEGLSRSNAKTPQKKLFNKAHL